MADNTNEHRPSGPRRYPGWKARQGEIALRRPWQRAVFIAGLVGFGLLALFGSLWLVGAAG